MWTLSPLCSVPPGAVPVLMSLFSFRCLHFHVVPPIAPLATADSLPTALPDLPATSGPTSALSISLQLSSCQASHSVPPLGSQVPASLLSRRTVKLPHPAGAPLAVPCGPPCQMWRRLPPPSSAGCGPTLGVATPVPIPPPLCPAPAQPVYPAAFRRWCPATSRLLPPTRAQTVQAAAPPADTARAAAAPPAECCPPP